MSLKIVNRTPVKNSFRTLKFDQLTLSENGVQLKYQNKPEHEIPFANLNKLYIKKYNLHPVWELLMISLPFVLVIFTIQYLELYQVAIISIILAVLIIKTFMNFKWYRFYIVLKDGTVFYKKVPLNKKPENVSVLEKVYAKYLQSSIDTIEST